MRSNFFFFWSLNSRAGGDFGGVEGSGRDAERRGVGADRTRRFAAAAPVRRRVDVVDVVGVVQVAGTGPELPGRHPAVGRPMSFFF